ncbi:MAG: phosphate acyltransferase PlsX [Candidatus Paraimprobicoccus trichonymphae]|uniref:Phosphate acyltransferase n=1 Tax=Candidatus Paraimprobicoccus trichonymphae TaxID=3033793 RepID=A0AA48IA66_9FIRM|nr:MAG: phosphate acyltransferase PlsX [Candidatus Paraimprobicoccus trichonymphae]
MRIIVDALGGDNAPLEIIKGCLLAQKEYNFEIILVGNEKIIKNSSEKNNLDIKNLDIRNSEGKIDSNDESVEIMKSKGNSSMSVGLNLLKNGDGDAFVSAGNSGALLIGSTFIVKRIKNVKRAAFAPVIPNESGFFMLIDSGANSECRAEFLDQFGILGSVYMEKVMNVKNPRIGLANIGTEVTKGDVLRKESFKLLSENTNINFIGNVEARDIPQNGADVVVTDGFTGNIILKLYEGMTSAIFKKFKNVLTKNVKTKIGSLLILPELERMKKNVDYNEYGGAPIVGISKPIFKAHGSSNAYTIKNALRLASEYVKQNIIYEFFGRFN